MIQPSPIRLGSLLFTLVDPERGHERDYNRWYERDHFYAGCMIGPWQFAGARFVATREEKSRVRRGPNEVVGVGGRGSYAGIYWVLDGHHDAWNRWAVDQVNALHEADRMFAHREHVHTGLFDRRWVANRDEDGVPVELALDHRFAGLVALVGKFGPGVDVEAAHQRLERAVAVAITGSPIALVLGCTPRPLLTDAPSDVPRTPDADRRFLQLLFVDVPAIDVWDTDIAELTAAIGGDGDTEVLWASPFRPTIVGTDVYTDELWEP